MLTARHPLMIWSKNHEREIELNDSFSQKKQIKCLLHVQKCHSEYYVSCPGNLTQSWRLGDIILPINYVFFCKE